MHDAPPDAPEAEGSAAQPLSAVRPDDPVVGAPIVVVPETPDLLTAAASRGMMALVLVGVAVVLLALLIMRWPVVGKADAPPEFGPQFQRVLAGLGGESQRGIAGVVVDLSVYAILIGVVLMALRTLRTGKRDWLGGLIVAGLLGMAYVTGMVLYIGPMISACGFSLIVFGGVVAWLAANTPESEAAPPVESRQVSQEPNSMESGVA
jgi:hypothetical protein